MTNFMLGICLALAIVVGYFHWSEWQNTRAIVVQEHPERMGDFDVTGNETVLTYRCYRWSTQKRKAK